MRENAGLQQAVETEEAGSDLPHLSAALTSSPAGGGTVLRVSPPAVGAHHDAPVTRISVGRGPFVNGPYGIDAAFHAKRTRLRFSVGDGVLDVPAVWGRKRKTRGESVGSLRPGRKNSTPDFRGAVLRCAVLPQPGIHMRIFSKSALPLRAKTPMWAPSTEWVMRELRAFTSSM